MREIKFRAWDGEEMHRVDQITFDPLCHMEHGRHILDEHNDIHPLSSIILMQWMGTKDYSNKELYEHDIVKMRNYLYVVEYKWYFFGYSPTWEPLNLKDGESMCQHELYSGEYHIIGNIHEHPNLLDK